MAFHVICIIVFLNKTNHDLRFEKPDEKEKKHYNSFLVVFKCFSNSLSDARKLPDNKGDASFSMNITMYRGRERIPPSSPTLRLESLIA